MRINGSHIGWWCQETRVQFSVDEKSSTFDKPCTHCIPVFRPLDVPEPSTWNLKDVNAVTATVRGKMVFATRKGVVPA